MGIRSQGNPNPYMNEIGHPNQSYSSVWESSGTLEPYVVPTGAWAGNRGVFGGGYTTTPITTIDYVNITSAGNATDFGDLTEARSALGSASNGSRGIWGGGYDVPSGAGGTNVIDYVTISSTGNAIDFGDLTVTRNELKGLSNGTRGVFGGGWLSPGDSNTIDYVTISSTGNASDFGDLTQARHGLAASSGETRGLFAGGNEPIRNTIDYITIAATGNATDFGDLSVTRMDATGVSDTTRAVFCGGRTPSCQDVMDYVTVASKSNASDFGNLDQARRKVAGLSGSAS